MSRRSATPGRPADHPTVTLSFLESFPRTGRLGLEGLLRRALTGGWAVDLLVQRAGLPRSIAGQILPFSSRRMARIAAKTVVCVAHCPTARGASGRAGAECAAG